MWGSSEHFSECNPSAKDLGVGVVLWLLGVNQESCEAVLGIWCARCIRKKSELELLPLAFFLTPMVR